LLHLQERPHDLQVHAFLAADLVFALHLVAKHGADDLELLDGRRGVHARLQHVLGDVDDDFFDRPIGDVDALLLHRLLDFLDPKFVHEFRQLNVAHLAKVVLENLEEGHHGRLVFRRRGEPEFAAKATVVDVVATRLFEFDGFPVVGRRPGDRVLDGKLGIRRAEAGQARAFGEKILKRTECRRVAFAFF